MDSYLILIHPTNKDEMLDKLRSFGFDVEETSTGIFECVGSGESEGDYIKLSPTEIVPEGTMSVLPGPVRDEP